MPSSAFPDTAPTLETAWVTMATELAELAISTRPVVVIAPHPDDETLAVGGLLAELVERQVDITVVAVTDGEASHPGAPGLAERRRSEQQEACRELGIRSGIRRLGLPDGGVADHLDELAEELAALCDADTVLVAPWEQDGHTDHDACGQVAHRVAAECGASLLAYPVWAWQWAREEDLQPLALRKITLSSSAHQAKSRAIDCYPSQIETPGAVRLGSSPIVDAETLRRFLRPFEVVIHVR